MTKNNRKIFQEALEELKTTDQVLILSHMRPDGDSIGSQIALTRTLNALGIKAIAVNDGPVPYFLEPFIKDTPYASLKSLNNSNTYHCAYVDCAEVDRVGSHVKAVKMLPVLNIDHHRTNTSYGKYNIVLSNAAATAEILADILFSLPIKIDAITAQALYIGIATDTGQFQYLSTTEHTFHICQKLIQQGANPHLAAFYLYENESFNKYKLLSRYLGGLTLELNNQVCIGRIFQSDYQQTGTDKEHIDGFVEYTRNIKNVKIGVLLEERTDGCVKGSLRAKDENMRVDVLASEFGGGGHACASGFSSNERFDTFYPLFIKKTKEHLLDK